MRIFYLRKSRLHVFFSFFLSILAVMAVSITTLSWFFQCGFMLVILFSGFFQLRCALHLHEGSITFLAKYTHQIWVIRSKRTGFVAATLLPNSIVTRYFMILYLQPLNASTSKKQMILIDRSCLIASEMRELCLLLAYQ
ncbi:MAG: hypothetical protein A3F10_04490 [Coxiella sp. RIFCSPHIGHO2_12_FULL_42_15]|nr:MAG: hypothetical protein A3F10_04490 [Coxiella sp. RIFCSPHIGHO2_12_FULL_42_15]